MSKHRFIVLIIFLVSLVLVACDPQVLAGVNPTLMEATTNQNQETVSVEEPPMKIQMDDLTLVYETRGEGQPVLMLHGWPTDRHSMIGAMEPIF